jgi:hypothetical protein
MNKTNWKCFIGIHDWEYIYEKYTDKFCGKEITKFYKSFRRCKRCDKYQIYDCGESACYWITLTKEAKQILKENMYRHHNGKLIANCKKDRDVS